MSSTMGAECICLAGITTLEVNTYHSICFAFYESFFVVYDHESGDNVPSVAMDGKSSR